MTQNTSSRSERALLGGFEEIEKGKMLPVIVPVDLSLLAQLSLAE